jgi:hypothetical protein
VTAAKPKFTPKPRYWTDLQVAARLGCSLSWFSENKAGLYRAGMPKPSPLFGNKTDSKALERWCDLYSGLVDQVTEAQPEFDEFRARVREMSSGAGRA